MPQTNKTPPRKTYSLSSKAILQCIKTAGHPLTENMLALRLNLPPKQHQRLHSLLSELETKLKLIRVASGYTPVLPGRLIEGTVKVLQSGAGFIVTDGADQPDAFLPPEAMVGLFSGDRVIGYLTACSNYDGRTEARILRILSNPPVVIGTLTRGAGRWIVKSIRAEDSHIVEVTLPEREAKEAGIAVVQVTDRPGAAGELAKGKVLSHLGDPEEVGMASRIAIARHGLVPIFDAKTISAAKTAKPPQPGHQRCDLTNLAFFTIDDDKSQDLDDALAGKRLRNGDLRVYVAISDVSEIVKPGKVLDLACRERGTSTYLPDRILPMLPPELSEKTLSLLPRARRAVVVAEFCLDRNGQLQRVRFLEAWIRSRCRMNYETAERLIQGRTSQYGKRPLPSTAVLKSLAVVAEAASAVRGVPQPDIARTNARVRIDARTGQVQSLEVEATTAANSLVETWMIATNRAAAKFLSEHGRTALYRLQDAPDDERLAELEQVFRPFGISLPTTWSAESMAELYRTLMKHPKGESLARKLVFSLPAARYTKVPGPHLCLAEPRYMHFTSPIRRYADLVNHRALKSLIRRRKPPVIDAELGEEVTAKARRAKLAERDVTRSLQCQFMSKHLGQAMDGTIAGIQSFGCFVRLDEYPGVEGLLHISCLGGRSVRYNSSDQSLVDPSTGRQFRPEMPIRVVLSDIRPWEGRLSLDLAYEPEDLGNSEGSAAVDYEIPF